MKKINLPKPAKSNTRAWQEQRNARRRKAYTQNKKHRARINNMNRESYRRTHEGFEQNIALLPEQVETVTQARMVTELGEERQTLTIEEMGLALGGYHKVVIYRWIKQEKFPEPDHNTLVGSVPTRVFLLGQAKELVRVFRQHQEGCAHFRSSHKETIHALFDAMKLN